MAVVVSVPLVPLTGLDGEETMGVVWGGFSHFPNKVLTFGYSIQN